mmetsp:Transcript_4191/g.8714  ORF Transcript_4191/g.8714 Transcript_4191/m.8714 type:complete len:822 (-) Transcript_4191:44-2509(-)
MVHIHVARIELDPPPPRNFGTRHHSYRGGDVVRGRAVIENGGRYDITARCAVEFGGVAKLRFHEAQTEYLDRSQTTYHYRNHRCLQRSRLEYGRSSDSHSSNQDGQEQQDGPDQESAQSPKPSNQKKKLTASWRQRLSRQQPSKSSNPPFPNNDSNETGSNTNNNDDNPAQKSNNNDTNTRNNNTNLSHSTRVLTFPPGSTTLPFDFVLRKNAPGTMEIRIGSGFNATYSGNPSEDNYGRMRYQVTCQLHIVSPVAVQLAALRHAGQLRATAAVPVAFTSPLPRPDSQLLSQTLVESTGQDLFAVRVGFRWNQVFRKKNTKKKKLKPQQQQNDSSHLSTRSNSINNKSKNKNNSRNKSMSKEDQRMNLRSSTTMRLSQMNNERAFDGASVGLGRVLERVGTVSMALHLDQRAYAPGQGVNVTGSCAINDTTEPQWLFMGIRMHAIFQGRGANPAIGQCTFQRHQDFNFVHEELEPGQSKYFNNATSWVLPPGMPPSFDGRDFMSLSANSLPSSTTESNSTLPIPGGTILKWTYEFFMWMGDPHMLTCSDDPRQQPIPGTTALLSVPILICCQKPHRPTVSLRRNRSVHVFSRSQQQQIAQAAVLRRETNDVMSGSDAGSTDGSCQSSDRGSSSCFFSSGEMFMYDKQQVVEEDSMEDLWSVFDQAMPLSERHEREQARLENSRSKRRLMRKTSGGSTDGSGALSHSINPIVEVNEDALSSTSSLPQFSSTPSLPPLKVRMQQTLEETATPTMTASRKTMPSRKEDDADLVESETGSGNEKENDTGGVSTLKRSGSFTSFPPDKSTATAHLAENQKSHPRTD